MIERKRKPEMKDTFTFQLTKSFWTSASRSRRGEEAGFAAGWAIRLPMNLGAPGCCRLWMFEGEGRVRWAPHARCWESRQGCRRSQGELQLRGIMRHLSPGDCGLLTSSATGLQKNTSSLGFRRLWSICLAIFPLLCGCGPATPAPAPAKAEPPLEIKTVHPAQGSITRSITLPGEIKPYQAATLYAKVTGYLKTITVD